MKALVASVALLLIVTSAAQAIKITLFTDTDTYVRQAQDIVVAKCTGPVPDRRTYEDGLYPVDVEIITVLKGARSSGKAKIATIYPMEAGKTYLLMSLGGSALDTDFLAVPQLSVVELPANFQFDDFKGKPVPDLVKQAFTGRRKENERQQQLLKEEKTLLDKAVSK